MSDKNEKKDVSKDAKETKVKDVTNTEGEKAEAQTSKTENKAKENKVEESKAKEEAKDEPSQTEDTKSAEVPKKFKKIVEEIEKMSVIELNELIKVFEEKFGVSAQATAVAPVGGGVGADAGASEQDSFTVKLTEVGGQKIAVIKVVKSLFGLGLKEAKDAVDGAPTILKEGVKKEEAEAIKKQIEEAGGKVTLK